MNKILLTLLVVCLVSVHAFVKRDAPEANGQNTLEKLQKDFAEKAKEFGKQFEDALNPEKVKKTINEMVENISKAMEAFKPTEKTAGAAA